MHNRCKWKNDSVRQDVKFFSINLVALEKRRLISTLERVQYTQLIVLNLCDTRLIDNFSVTRCLNDDCSLNVLQTKQS